MFRMLECLWMTGIGGREDTDLRGIKTRPLPRGEGRRPLLDIIDSVCSPRGCDYLTITLVTLLP